MPTPSVPFARVPLGVRVVLVALTGAVGVCVVFSLVGWTREGSHPFRHDWLYDSLFVGGAVVCALRAVLVRAERPAWTCFALGTGLAAAGYVYYTIAVRNGTPPYPSPSDALWLSLYPFSYAGLTLLARERLGPKRSALWLEGLIGALAIAAVGSALLLPAVTEATHGPLSTVATNISYPLADLAIVGFVIGLGALTGRRLGRSWLLLLGGFTISLGSDAVYMVETARGTYDNGGALDAAWPLVPLMIAFAAWQRIPTRQADADMPAGSPRANVAVPGVLCASAAALLMIGSFGRISTVAAALASLTLVAAGARTLLAARQLNELQGLLPICAGCKSVRNDRGYWTRIEAYVSAHSAAEFSHGMCPDCIRDLYPDIADELEPSLAGAPGAGETTVR